MVHKLFRITSKSENNENTIKNSENSGNNHDSHCGVANDCHNVFQCDEIALSPQ